MRHGRLLLAVCLLTLSGPATRPAAGPPKKAAPPAEAADEEASPEEAKEKAIAERFRKVLESNPRRGTALDRLYGYHVERGTLDKLVAGYADRTKKDPRDGTAWMIVGLLESQRGKDAAAVAAFRKAEENLPDSAVPAYYLGQSLVLVGRPEEAAEAFERALTRKPNRNDLLDTFQALGRVYQRSQRPEQALAVWNRLEKLYPDDARVQEQIATTLVEEGQFAEALPRLERLARQTEDKYRQSTLRMDAADLKVKLKRTPEALADFEKLLGELDPDSWLYRDVRRRVEDVFLRNDDLAGLAKYYEKWLEKNPTDVDAVARLAKSLGSQGRVPEARAWLEKGIAVAPSHRGLRQALIDQYAAEQNFAAAAAQYEAMDKADPNNPDTLREWGKLLLRDPVRPEAERRAAAAAVWKRILEKKPKDPVTASQVADLLRTAGAADDAASLYQRAIELAPNAAQYREYLGEYYHSLKRPADALATWRPIAEGPNRNAKNLARLAEVFAGFGYRKEALEAMADAVNLEKDDFTLRMTYAGILHQEGRNDDALDQLGAAERLTSNPEEAEQSLTTRIKVYQATEKLAERIDELQKELDAGTESTADRWLRLARYFEANKQADRAAEAVAKAREKDPKSVPVLTAAARIYESGGDMLAAADANRKLAALDRRFRTEYLTAVAKLEQRLGRREQALAAGRDLLAASPGNPDVYKFFAELCFQLGDGDEGLEALRRSVRANPSDPQGLITLANALGERVRQGEAIELLWRAFEKTNELEGKLGVVERITQLYLENNQFDRLVERLERERREAEKVREMTMCIAQAYATAGDLGTARGQLERLLTENSRDVNLLGQLVTLCEQEGDPAAALKYQRQVAAAAPNNHDHQLKLAQLLTRTGETEEAAEIWVKLVAAETEPHRNLTAIDQLLTAGKYDAALAILSRMLLRKPGDWELLYRQGGALALAGKSAESAAPLKALLALRVPEDEPGEVAKYQVKQVKKKAAKANQPGQANQPQVYNPYAKGDEEWSLPPLVRRAGRIQLVRMAVGLNPRYYYYGAGPAPFHAVADFGEARMAALGWLYVAAAARDEGDAFVRSHREAATRPGADPHDVWDWCHLQALRLENKALLLTTLTLSKGDDPAGALALMSVLSTRGNSNFRYRQPGADVKDTTPPLPAGQLDQVLAAYRRLRAVRPDWVTVQITRDVMAELKRAKRTDEEQALYRQMLAGATTTDRVKDALGVAVSRNDVEGTSTLYAKLDRLQGVPKNAAQLPSLPTRLMLGQLEMLMARRAEEKKFADVLALADLGLATARRQNLAAPRTASSSRRFQSGPLNLWIYAAKGSSRNVQLNFPSPSDYYDSQTLSLLYEAFTLFKEADLTSDLLAHLRKQAAAAPGPDALYLRLALGYLHWWADERDEATAELTQAVRAAPADHGLLLEVAAMREQNGEHAAALALLDSVTPSDTQMMVRREEAALRLAERTGNLDRARQAADRLFGLRLDADKQLELAAKMHRLGLSAMAETVLNRAQRQAGNKTATLLRLMTQYQGQNQTDLAVQIARQILRKGPSAPNPYNRGGDETDNARSQAIGVLARSGQIKEMIERAEAQLKVSPKSVQIYQSLAGFYQAAGDKPRLKAALLKMAELKPDDGKLRHQIARDLQQAGERDAALEQYKAAIKLDPAGMGNAYWEITNLFAQANKLEDLARVFDEIDLKKLGNYWSTSQTVGQLMQNDGSRELGLKLFRKAWNAYPENRGYMLGNLYGGTIWRLPEIYDYAKEAVFPRDDTGPDPWQAASQIISYGQEGRVDGVITRLLSIARKQQRLPELRAEVEAALARRPDWPAGKPLLAVIDVQLGRREQGRREWEEAFADPAEIPVLARYVLVQELEFYGGFEDLAVKTLEGGFDEVLTDGNQQFDYGAGRRLVWWYQQLGRKEDARKAMLRFTTGTNPGYGGGWWQYQTVSNNLAVARELLRTGDAVEAVRVYNALLADRDTLDQANAWYGGERFDQQVERGLQEALKSLKPGTLPETVAALLTPREGAANRAALDLALLVDSRDLSRATLNSVFDSAIRSAAKAPAVRKDALARLAELEKKHPNDLSVLTAAALAALAGDDADAARGAVERLLKLAESTPLEPLPNGRANARQRAEAMAQVPLWLVARECLGKGRDPLRPAGERLAGRAVAAARRQQERLYAAAVLREWGQLDLERGERAGAEARWAEMLELVLPVATPPKAAGTAPAAPAPAPAAPAPVPAAKKSQARSAAPAVVAALLVAFQAPPAAAAPAPAPRAHGNVPVLTAEQFEQAYQVASLAAEKGLVALSLRAMKEAVRGGPPVPPSNPRNGGFWSNRQINGVWYYQQRSGTQTTGVDQALAKLVPKWRAAGASPGAVYDVLAAAALPAARPAEVFLYADGPSNGGLFMNVNGRMIPAEGVGEETAEERGLARLLSDAAVEAGKVDDLRARAEARAGQPLGELPAKVLLATLAVRAGDDARVSEAFKGPGERIRKDAQATTNDLVASALLPAFADPRYAGQLAPLVEKAAENYAATGNSLRAAELNFRLADYHLARGDAAAARARFKAVEAVGRKVGLGQYDPHLPLARQYLKAGWPEDALRELGLHADGLTVPSGDPRLRGRLPEPTLDEFPLLVRRLLELPAAKRYDALKAWSLPTAGRKSVRYYVGLTPRVLPPPEVVKLPPVPPDRVSSTLLLLAEAAGEAGKGDELTAEADKLAAEKVEGADLLRVLTYLARGRGKEIEPAVKAYAEAAFRRMLSRPEVMQGQQYYNGVDHRIYQPAPFYPSEFLFATLCLADPALAVHVEGLLGPMQACAQNTGVYQNPNNNTPDYLTRVQDARDRLVAARAGAPGAADHALPPRWHSATARSVWFAHEGYLTNRHNDQTSFLLPDAPLGGTFEFSVEASAFAVSAVGYGGVVFQPPSVWPVGRGEFVSRNMEGLWVGEFIRLTVQVSPGKVRCLRNGNLFFEDTDPPPISPWPMLVAPAAGARPVFRKFTLGGKPEVPSEVRLTAGDYLDGWVAQPYGGAVPPRLTPKEPQTANQRAFDQWGNLVEEKKDPVYDWQAKGGEILGRKLDRASDRPVPSGLAYFRPLRSGEAVRYEFFYEPGKTHAHPSLGRLAFLLEADGVKLHWLTDKAVDDWTGLPADNAVAAPGARPGPLPLKPGDWNAVSLRLEGDTLHVELNGSAVCEAKLPADGERQFGLFHYRDRTAARVRNVVLTGPWKAVGAPEEFGFATKTPSPAAARALRRQLGERYYLAEAGDVVARARKLPPAERYALLAGWVLPTESRPAFQLAGAVKPLDVLGVVDQKDQPAGRRVTLGGRLEAPCLELVAAAREAGKLDELADRLARAEAPGDDELFRRSKAALLVAVRAAQGRDDDSAAALRELLAPARALRPDAPGPERWPDLVAATAALDRPALRGPADGLIRAANESLDQAVALFIPLEDGEWWQRAWRTVRGRARVLAQPDGVRRPYGSDPGLSCWSPVAALVTGGRAGGSGVPHWSFHDGTVYHFPGNGEDYLVLRTPLRGDFEVTCGLRLGEGREAHVRFGAYQFDLDREAKKYKLHTTVRQSGHDVTISPPLPGKVETYRLRVAVKDGWLRVAVDGREVAAERVGAAPDPWLMLHCPSLNSGELRDLKIDGKPAVPDSVDLLAGEDLPAWRASPGTVSEAEARMQGMAGNGWARRGEELFEAGKKPDPPEEGKPVPPRYFPESAVFYHRPFLEDGAVEYEFYYDPDRAHVYPALDRLVFLLEPEGVRLHWLTDAYLEKSGAKVDNAADEPACRRGPSRLPLNPKGWNRVRLAVAGDTVKVALNGTEVYERPIEPTNGRFFGLFHWTDRTEARVRGVTLTGDWPRQLPPGDRLFERK